MSVWRHVEKLGAVNYQSVWVIPEVERRDIMDDPLRKTAAERVKASERLFQDFA